MAEYVLLVYDDSVQYRSLTVPKGAEKLSSARSLPEIAEQAAEMGGIPPSEVLTDGVGGEKDE
jgi:hypothetical protein